MNEKITLFVLLLFGLPSLLSGQNAQIKPRTIVTTDGEIDDVDSFIRMLLYANEFQIEGLVYSSSMWHYQGDGKGTIFTSEMEMTKRIYGAKTDLRWPGTEWMNPLLDAYEEIYPNLVKHAEGYPTADHLRSLVRVGNIDFEGEFMGEEIINNHGPLLKQYYSYGDGQKQEGDDEHTHGDPTRRKGTQWGDFGKFDFISEGDSPAYLHLIDVGLDNLNHPEWGGWGGRLVQSAEQPTRWEDGETAKDYNPFTQKMDPTYPQIRWVEAIQHDFAGRADWCVANYKDANHPPVVTAIGPTALRAKAGEAIRLKIKANDPDNDELETRCWIYQEVGTYAHEASVTSKGKKATIVLSPEGAGTLHIIAEVKDQAEHPMTRYQRFVIEVK